MGGLEGIKPAGPDADPAWFWTQISISSMTFHTAPEPLWRTRWPTRGSFNLSLRVKKR